MKSQVSPAVAAILIVIVVAVVGMFLYKSTSGPTQPGGGKLQSDLDFSKVEKDPVKLQAQLKADLDKAEAGKKK